MSTSSYFKDGVEAFVPGGSFDKSWGGLMWKWVSLSFHLTVGIFLLRFVVKHIRTIYYSVICIPRDLKLVYKFTMLNINILYCQLRDLSVPDALDNLVRRDPGRVLIYFEDEEWTAREVQQLSLKVANYFLKQGVRKGDVIGLFMENRPEYISIWIGLSRIGCLAALINTNLKNQPLNHSIKSVDCKAVIYGGDLGPALEELKSNGDIGEVSLYHCGDVKESLLVQSTDLMTELKGMIPRNVKNQQKFRDPLLYIYTSGTTGLPKAAVIKNSRLLFAATSFYNFCGLVKSDRIYTTLPMYHISSAAVTVLTVLFGTPIILRRKFSAGSYWKDCVKYKATVGHYIGELCRYLLAQPVSPLEKNHSVRLMFGNGVRPDVWVAFQERFAIKSFREFYGSTEGNSNMVNTSGKAGATGFLPHYLQWVVPLTIIKIDETTGNPVRDPVTGAILKCKEDEVGELIAKIYKNHPIKDFEGYADKSASESKILKDVFAKGDAWFRSGDLFSKDKYGLFYFKDRIGDTFRWKGENCSTTEIESVLSSLCGMQDVVMFGVSVPGAEGKAGMSVICDVQKILNLPQLVEEMNQILPKYAQPLFLRVSASADITGTFKLKKTEYEKVGYNPSLTTDKIYFLQNNEYIPLDEQLYETILQGKVRV